MLTGCTLESQVQIGVPGEESSSKEVPEQEEQIEPAGETPREERE